MSRDAFFFFFFFTTKCQKHLNIGFSAKVFTVSYLNPQAEKSLAEITVCSKMCSAGAEDICFCVSLQWVDLKSQKGSRITFFSFQYLSVMSLGKKKTKNSNNDPQLFSWDLVELLDDEQRLLSSSLQCCTRCVNVEKDLEDECRFYTAWPDRFLSLRGGEFLGSSITSSSEDECKRPPVSLKTPPSLHTRPMFTHLQVCWLVWKIKEAQLRSCRKCLQVLRESPSWFGSHVRNFRGGGETTAQHLWWLRSLLSLH